MTTNHHTPPHQDASKDPIAVRAALSTWRRQYADILRNYGVAQEYCEVEADQLEATTEALLTEVNI